MKALRLHNEGWKHASIAREIGISTTTLRRWFRKAGVKPKRVGGAHDPNEPVGPKVKDPVGDAIQRDLLNAATEAGALARGEAIEAENAQIDAASGKALTPADQYQSYIATKGIQKIRDGIGNIPPPRTIKELETLDGIVRRSLGLDNKNSGGSGGSLRVDINILNNTVPDKLADGAVKTGPSHAIDVEALEEETRRKVGAGKELKISDEELAAAASSTNIKDASEPS
jgi:transposase-like protein